MARSDRRPAPAEIESLLPRFVGDILQTPPTFSAIRIAGARAYDLAREGETFEIEPRLIHVYRLELISAEPDAAVLEAECGKGAYVRAIARDLGRALGCLRACDRIAGGPASDRFQSISASRSIACRMTRI